MNSKMFAAMAAIFAVAACQTGASQPPISGGAPTDRTVLIARNDPSATKPTAAPKNAPKIAAAPNAAGYSHDAATRLFRAAQYDAAEALCQQAVSSLERQAKGAAAPASADPLNDLATVYLRIGRYGDARKLVDKAADLLDPARRDQAVVLARVYTNRAWGYYAWGQTGQGQKWFTAARDILQKNGDSNSLDMAEVVNDLGLVLEDGGDEQQADGRRMLYQAWELRRKLAGDLSPECEESLSNLGLNILFHSADPDDVTLAVATLHKALDTAQKLWGEGHPETALARANVAMADQMINANELAEKEVRDAMTVTTKVFGQVSQDRASELQVLGAVLQAQQRYPEAEAAFKEAISINESVFGPTHPFVGSALTYLQGLYEATHDEAKTRETKTRADKLRGLDI